jgi:chemotaxis protein CheC
MIKTLPLSEEQLNSLIEIGNIGWGQAASHLSNLIRRSCTIDIPGITYLDFEGIQKMFYVEDSLAVALRLKILGDVASVLVVSTPRLHAERLADHMTASQSPNTPFTAQSGLKKLGETLIQAFSDSMSSFLMTKTKFVMPNISVDTWATVLNLNFKDMIEPDARHLILHSRFFDEPADKKTFEGRFIYILGPQAQETILNRLNLLIQDKLA